MKGFPEKNGDLTKIVPIKFGYNHHKLGYNHHKLGYNHHKLGYNSYNYGDMSTLKLEKNPQYTYFDI